MRFEPNQSGGVARSLALSFIRLQSIEVLNFTNDFFQEDARALQIPTPSLFSYT